MAKFFKLAFSLLPKLIKLPPGIKKKDTLGTTTVVKQFEEHDTPCKNEQYQISNSSIYILININTSSHMHYMNDKHMDLVLT